MPCVIEAFKQMERRGLIAKRECYHEGCSEAAILQAARQWGHDRKGVHGFVHVGEWDPCQSLEELRVPLLFGVLAGEKVIYRDPGCVAVGEVVAECLREQSIRFEWDKVPGSPIWLKADELLSEMPLQDDEEITPTCRVVHSGFIPDSAFDKIGGNEVSLLNVAKASQLPSAPTHLQGPRSRPRVGDGVKLGFLVTDAIAPAVRKEFGNLTDKIQVERMWVEVTSVLAQFPKVYRGELVNAPVFIDPAKLRLGSPVNLTRAHVYPVDATAKILAQR